MASLGNEKGVARILPKISFHFRDLCSVIDQHLQLLRDFLFGCPRASRMSRNPGIQLPQIPQSSCIIAWKGTGNSEQRISSEPMLDVCFAVTLPRSTCCASCVPSLALEPSEGRPYFEHDAGGDEAQARHQIH